MTADDLGIDRPAIGRVIAAVGRDQVTPFIRISSAALAVAMFLLGYGPLIQADSPAYDRPIFDGVFAFASPLAWGIGFMVPAALLGIAALSGRAIVYLTGITVGALTLAGWASMIVLTAATDDGAVLTSGALGLYLGTFVGIIGTALSPRQIKAERPMVAVLEDHDAPVPLRRVG